MLLSYMLIYCSFISLAQAVCCSNHKALCIFNAISCTPNCPDKVSYCVPDKETCANNGLGDTWGGCVDIKTSTTTKFEPKYTATKYTATVIRTSSTQVIYTYKTQVSALLVTNTITSTRTITATTTSTLQPKIRLLAKRENPVTKTITELPCSTARDDRCTTTLSLIYTQYVVATDLRTSISQSISRYTVTSIAMIDATKWVTAFSTRPGGTISQTPTGSSTVTEVVVATETYTEFGGTGSSSANSATTTGPVGNSVQQGTPMSIPTGEGQLSTGAKAAIGTTVGTVVIAIVGLFFLWRRKKKEKKVMYTPVSASPGHAHAQPQMVQPEPYHSYAAMPARKPVPQTHYSTYAPLLSQGPHPIQDQQYHYPASSPQYNTSPQWNTSPQYNPYQYPYPEQTVHGPVQATPIHKVYARPIYVPYSSHVSQ